MCSSMVDIQSVAAEIRRGIKKEEEDRRKRKETTGQKNNVPPLLHRAAIIKTETAMQSARSRSNGFSHFEYARSHAQ